MTTNCSRLPLAALLLVIGAVGGAAQTSDDPARILAPTGKLRVAVYPGSPTSMIEGMGGDRKGLTYDVGAELAKRLGVPFEAVIYQRPAEVAEALKSGQADFTITNASPTRMKDLDFTPTLIDLELGYLVVPGSPVSALADIDRPGIRVGVSEGSTSL